MPVTRQPAPAASAGGSGKRNPVNRTGQGAELQVKQFGLAVQKSLRWLPGGGTTMHRYLWLVLAGVSLSGCGPTRAEKNWSEAQYMCQLDQRAGSTSPDKYSECVNSNFRAYEILSRYTPPVTQAPASPQTYYPQAAAASPPASDAPPLPNIIPPTVRCQSVPAGMGTVQTICR